jgi:hypothetical protein
MDVYYRIQVVNEISFIPDASNIDAFPGAFKHRDRLAPAKS